ncbi:hypothetical protein P3X46_023043 [Hevea brasiliensis]|uniref:Peptidase A1 domain-containing protein n=1 Tax=Hevea brasiliensis TaxID=3981 RepID=A0ABQ9LBL8_HEVBR|nr:hypothetical protein P3X46_023043 [Hevea brasiliensis]
MGIVFCALFALLLTSPFACSRTLPHAFTTSLLDVKASIQRTKDVFSSLPKTTPPFNQQESVSSSSSWISMELHSRTSIQKASHTDYKSLTLARLERDSARVRSLTARLDLVIHGISTSDLKPLDGNMEFKAEDLQSPVISGISQGSGEYFSRLGIGKPPSSVYMVLDTGSDVSWVQCAPCAGCYRQADPIFEPGSSISYSHLTCETKQCKSLDISECRNGTCLYEGLFVGAAGLLGLGGGSLSFPSQINATSFSYCLTDRDSDSASTLEFNSTLLPNAVTAPLIRNHELETFYFLGITGLSVGGELLSVPESAFKMDESGNGGIIIDSGTAITRLQTDTYNSLRKAFVNGTKNLPSTNGVALFDTCYDLSSKTRVEVPTNYLIPVDSEGTFCFAFAPTTSVLSIIRNVQQQGTRVSFDIANSRVGFQPNKC